jgi:hypothetical protein
MSIQLRIVRGDARHFETDVLVTGDRNTFLHDIESVEGKQLKQDDRFKIYTFGAAEKTCKVLRAQKFPYQAVVAFHIVSRKPTSKNAFKEKSFRPLIEIMNYIVKELSPKELTFLPFSWRNPLFVAIGTIYAIWFSAYRIDRYIYQPHFKIEQNTIRSYMIISDSGIDCYKNVLANDCQLLKQYFQRYPNSMPMLGSIMEHEEPELKTFCYEESEFVTHYTLGENIPRKYQL